MIRLTATLAALTLSATMALAEGKHTLAIQVDQNDPAVMNLALNNVARYSPSYLRCAGRQRGIVMVAYGPGLMMYTEDSAGAGPHQPRWAGTAGITFAACGNTLAGLEKKAGHKVAPARGSEVVPSGVVRLSGAARTRATPTSGPEPGGRAGRVAGSLIGPPDRAPSDRNVAGNSCPAVVASAPGAQNLPARNGDEGMKYPLGLGTGDLTVSELCLGSMTWGSQNTEAEGHAQIDMALDAASISSTPPRCIRPTRSGRNRGPDRRDHRLLDRAERAARRCGDGHEIAGAGPDAVRGGAPITGDPASVDAPAPAADRPIDLYQLHWPNRGSYHFRQNWGFDPSGPGDARRSRDEGGVEALRRRWSRRASAPFGLSNETAWGMMTGSASPRRPGRRASRGPERIFAALPACDTDMAEISPSRGGAAAGLLAARGGALRNTRAAWCRKAPGARVRRR